MVEFLQSIANGFTIIIDYIVGLVSAGIGYIGLIFESSVFLGSMIGFYLTFFSYAVSSLSVSLFLKLYLEGRVLRNGGFYSFNQEFLYIYN